MGLRLGELRDRLVRLLLTDSAREYIVLHSPEYIELERTFKGREEEFYQRGSQAIVTCAALELEAGRLAKIIRELEVKRSDLEEQLALTENSPTLNLGRCIEEESPHLVIHLDNEGVVRYFNPSARACISYKGEIVGKKPSQILNTKDKSLRLDRYFWNYLLGFESHARDCAQGEIPFPHNIFEIGGYRFRVDGYVHCAEEGEFMGGSIVLTPKIEAKSFFDKGWISWANSLAIKGRVSLDNVMEDVYHPIERLGRDINYLDFRKAQIDADALGTIAKFYRVIKSQGREFKIRGLPDEQISLLLSLGVDREDIRDAKMPHGKIMPHARGTD